MADAQLTGERIAYHRKRLGPPLEEANEVLEVAPVGLQRVGSGTTLGCEHLEERLQMLPLRRDGHAPAPRQLPAMRGQATIKASSAS